jgi:RNA-binding protein
MSAQPVLSSAERKNLRGRAMALKPAVLVGRAGVSASVIASADAALAREGLIKVRIEAPDRAARAAALDQLATATGAAVCGQVGHTASLFRPKPATSGDAPQPASRS